MPKNRESSLTSRAQTWGNLPPTLGAAFLFSLLLILSGCATYTVGQEKFSSSSKAMHRLDQVLAEALEGVTPTAHPAHGTALVLVPSRAEIQRHYLQFRGDPSQTRPEHLEYMTTFADKSIRIVAAAITKRQIFDSTSTAPHEGNPESATTECDHLVYLHPEGWFLKNKPDAQATRIPVDPSEIQHFLDSLEQLARGSSASSQ